MTHNVKEEKKVFTVEEIADQLGVSKNLVYRQVRAGTIPSVRLGDRWLVSAVSLNKFLSGEQSTPVGDSTEHS